jgi:hypothetical protein
MCTSLEKVYYPGSEEQWKKTEIGENNEYLKNADIVFNYNEPISEIGDVNKDGAINNKDVVALFKAVSNGDVEYDRVYDFNEDGAVNNKDVVALFKHVSAT